MRTGRTWQTHENASIHFLSLFSAERRLNDAKREKKEWVNCELASTVLAIAVFMSPRGIAFFLTERGVRYTVRGIRYSVLLTILRILEEQVGFRCSCSMCPVPSCRRVGRAAAYWHAPGKYSRHM